jgi:hypothetical protein
MILYFRYALNENLWLDIIVSRQFHLKATKFDEFKTGKLRVYVYLAPQMGRFYFSMNKEA